MKKPKMIVIEPRFEDGKFAGYDQIAGNVFFDTSGHLYALVSLEDFLRVKDQLAVAIEALESYSDLKDGSVGTRHLALNALKDIKDLEEK